ncbi:MAG: hypothetical protein ACM358_04930 [Gemmatimonadota bacterium]
MSDLHIDIGPEARNFIVGETVVLRSTDGGRTWRKLTGWRLVAYHVRRRAHDWTRWWRPRDVVSAVDAEAGVITIRTERWSWRRWRWERIV